MNDVACVFAAVLAGAFMFMLGRLVAILEVLQDLTMKDED
jgi:hypothetical protein